MSNVNTATFLAGVLAMTGTTLDDHIPGATDKLKKFGNNKQHWKKSQTDEERNNKLAAAEAKRERKKNR